jgi:2-polyprenyl-3-methyl-5-hydroxy-6-metoxy-1,4-benzoquinol methylase
MSSVFPGGLDAVGSEDGVHIGNAFDKYGSHNPVVRRLMSGFQDQLDDLLKAAAPRSVLDVGCGEGVVTEAFAERLGSGRVTGIDLDDPRLEHEWSRRRRPNLEFRVASSEALPFGTGEFDLVAAIEVLEHVADPEAALGEMTRVAASHLLVSVPREPLWRALNVARGAYLRELGNTPGHRHHWTRARFVSLLGRYGRVVENRAPVPWTMLLVRLP